MCTDIYDSTGLYCTKFMCVVSCEMFVAAGGSRNIYLEGLEDGGPPVRPRGEESGGRSPQKLKQFTDVVYRF